MPRVFRGYDWGERSPAWAGIVSDVRDVAGDTIHLLRREGVVDGPIHVFVPPMGIGSWSWIEVLARVPADISVLAPDLPGSGRSRAVGPATGGVEASTRFLEELAADMRLEGAVVHGHSMGGLSAALFAARAPDRVSRLILTSAPLPGRPDPVRYPEAWRLGLDLSRPIVRTVVGAGIRLKASSSAAGLVRVGTDPSRISPDLLALLTEELDGYRVGWRIDAATEAVVSVVRALTVDEAATRAELDKVVAPTLLLWGGDDRVIPRRLVDDLVVARPAWQSRVLPGVGHLLPWEAPDLYVASVTSG